MLLIIQIAGGIVLGGLALVVIFNKSFWESLWSFLGVLFLIGVMGYGFYANAIKMTIFLCSIFLPLIITISIAAFYDRASADNRLRIKMQNLGNSYSNLPKFVKNTLQSVTILVIFALYGMFYIRLLCWPETGC